MTTGRGLDNEFEAGKPLVLAHRGWSAAFPENTLSAFHEALLAGADGLEFDVQLTVDGAIVVIHDADVARTTNGIGLVAELTLAAMQSFNVAARWTDRAPEPIPTLREVLDLAYGLNKAGLYNIEIKTYTDDWAKLADAIAELAATHPLRSRLLFSSFNHEAVAYLKQKMPDAKIGLLFEDDVPIAWEKALELHACSVNMDYRYVTRAFVEASHAHGIKVVAWTVDAPADLACIADTGADIVITNRVDVGLAMLR